jgi:hypothetical protein
LLSPANRHEPGQGGCHFGEQLVILLGGGTKQRQQRDVNAAIANWQDYKRRKEEKLLCP